MDSNSDSRTTGQLSSTYPSHLEGATDVGITTGTPGESQTFRVVTSTSPRLDTQSRSNLRQASVALDTAYERITTLRNSINSMLNRIPAEVTRTGTSTSSSTNASDAQPHHSLSHDASIRPPHSALVLSPGEQVVEELNLRAARLRSLIPPSARQRLEQFESSSRNQPRREFALDLPRLDRTAGDTRPAPPPPRSPPMPDLILPNARGPHSVHRDDSSTMIGRRVAARVNAADGHSSLSSRLTLSQVEQRLQAQTAQVARELEDMTQRLAATTSRRVELASSRTRSGNTATAAQEHQAVAPSSASRDVPNRTVAGGPFRPARDVTLIDNTTRIFLPQPISRTSSDGTPIDDPSAPARRSLSAAFREHIATYRDHAQVGNTPQDTPRNLANAPEVRGTLVNLLTRDREEQIIPVRQSEHTRLSVETSRRDDPPVRSDPLSPAGRGQGRRRRGWTRLNADGDEIDSDEDSNVSAQTRRLRMRFTYGTTNVDQPATRSHTVTIEDILWRTSGSDSEADAVSLSADTTESCQSLFQGSPPRPSIRYPHPLPTPVEDMLIYPTTKTPRQPRVVCVSKYASLAGR